MHPPPTGSRPTAPRALLVRFNCVNVVFGCSNVAERIVAMDKPTDTADHYLEARFTVAAGSLEPGANSKGIDLQLFRTDHKKRKQSDDRSFDAEMTSCKPEEKITAYKRGDLVRGEEPDERPGLPDHEQEPRDEEGGSASGGVRSPARPPARAPARPCAG
ncbi:hypothetical protein ACFU3E_09515 [Streptomyces sp. NPDC057424]|uniref:hypothetical protein n=1 Tax=Streptomyces sp. NPDC057424 TaxID=3346127 RepID=UPI0036ADE70B